MSGYITNLQQLDFDSRLPKYRQVILAVSRDIRKSVLLPGDRIPSINEASSECNLSRDTVEKAYKELTRRGMIRSIPGKGFFVAEDVLSVPIRVLTIFDRLDETRWDLYRSLTKELEGEAELTLLSYEHNYRLLNLSLEEHRDDYDFFVVIPHFFAYQDDLKRAMESVATERLIVLTHSVAGLDPQTTQLIFDRKNAWDDALSQVENLVKAFRRVVLYFPDDFRFPQEILESIEAFCIAEGLPFKAFTHWEDRKVQLGDLAFVLEDETLAHLVAYADREGLSLGKDLGVVSFESRALKSTLAGGITTLGYDYEELAKMAAMRIRRGEPQQGAFPLHWSFRASFR